MTTFAIPEGTILVPRSPWLCLSCAASLPMEVDRPMDSPPCCASPLWLRVATLSPIPAWKQAAA